MTGALTAEAQQQITAVCDRVAEQVPRLASEVTELIRGRIPEYDAVPRAEQRDWIDEQMRGLLSGLGHFRPPGAEDLRRARELGRARAESGLRIELLLSAYHFTYQEIWNAVLQGAAATDPQLTGSLIHLVNPMWTWVQLMTNNASDAYAEALRRSQAAQANLRYRLLRALAGPEPDLEQAATLAAALGYAADGSFQALCTPAEHWPDPQLDVLGRRLAMLPGHIEVIAQGAAVTILAQRADPALILETLHRTAADAPVGIGLTRDGLLGAAASIIDAEQALDRSGPAQPTRFFAEDWLAASLFRQKARLAPLFADAAAIARTDPHLAEAVQAFAANGLSITAAAKALNLHPNSVAYRLDRWHQRTGWNPRSGDGLIASLTALDLYNS